MFKFAQTGLIISMFVFTLIAAFQAGQREQGVRLGLDTGIGVETVTPAE